MFSISGLESALRHNIVEFEFIKKNGDVRTATGTLNPKWVARNTKWSSRGGVSSPKVLPFYDIDKMEWRSLRRDATINNIKIVKYI